VSYSKIVRDGELLFSTSKFYNQLLIGNDVLVMNSTFTRRNIDILIFNLNTLNFHTIDHDQKGVIETYLSMNSDNSFLRLIQKSSIGIVSILEMSFDATILSKMEHSKLGEIVQARVNDDNVILYNYGKNEVIYFDLKNNVTKILSEKENEMPGFIGFLEMNGFDNSSITSHESGYTLSIGSTVFRAREEVIRDIELIFFSNSFVVYAQDDQVYLYDIFRQNHTMLSLKFPIARINLRGIKELNNQVIIFGELLKKGVIPHLQSFKMSIEI
jgi:hypothetical protein